MVIDINKRNLNHCQNFNMEIKTYKKLKKLIDQAIAELEKKATLDGSIFSDDYEDAVLEIKRRIVEELGYNFQEYLELDEKISKLSKLKIITNFDKIGKNILEIDKKIPTKEEIANIVDENIKKQNKPPKIINKIVKEVVKEKEKPIVINKIIKEKEIDKKSLSELKKDITELQLFQQDLMSDIKASKDFIKNIDGNIKDKIKPNFENFAKEVHSQLIWLQSSLQNQIGEVRNLIGNENLWDRIGTTLVPHTAGDNIETAGSGTFGDGLVLGIDAATNTAGKLKLWSEGANNYYTTFTAGTQTANATYTLPTSMPTGSSKFLQSTTTGVLSWESIDLSGLVPYTGATSPVDLGSQNFTTTGIGTFGSIKVPFIYPSSDSTTAFQIRKADGTTSVLNVDTTNSRIGIGTTSPREALDITGNITTNWTDDGRFIGMQYQTGTQYRLGMMLFGTQRETRIVSQSNDGINKSAITFYTGATPSERMRITKDGYVGIGTTAPTQKLTVVGTGITPENSSSGASADAMLSVQGNGAAFIMGRDVLNDIEFMMGVSATEGNPFIGSITNHRLSLRTNSTTQWSISTAGHLLSGLDGTSSKNITTAGNASFGKVGIGTAAGSTIPLTFAATTGQKFDLYAGGGYSFGVESNEFRFALGSGAGNMTFRIGPNAYNDAATERMRLTTTGLGIGTTSPLTPLHVSGAVLSVGTFGAGYTEGNIGAGTRMLWYPRKSAFRAGTVSGTQWNNANIGTRSTGLGYDVIASGDGSTALNYYTTASGVASLAAGFQSTASGNYSASFNFLTIASGFGSLAVNYYSRAYGNSSLSSGHFGVNYGRGSFVGGYNENVNFTSLIAGTGVANKYSGQFAFGYATSGNTLKAEGNGSVAMGQDVNALNANLGVGNILTVQVTSGGSGYSTSRAISGWSLDNGGSGYSVNDTLTASSGDSNATFNVDSVDGSGTITGLSLTYEGTGYSTGSSGLSGGNGSNASIQIHTVVTSTNLTITTGDNNAVIEVEVDSGSGSVTGVNNIVSAGSGYSVGAGQATSGGGNNDCTVEITEINDVSNGNVLVFGRGFTETLTNSFNVGFGSRQLQITSSKVNINSLPTGTLASPPSGLNVGDMWLDTTSSAQYPVVRYRAS